jgi:hypothetical protein
VQHIVGNGKFQSQKVQEADDQEESTSAYRFSTLGSPHYIGILRTRILVP